MFAAGLQSNGNRLDQLRDIFPPPPPPPLFYHRSVIRPISKIYILPSRKKKKKKKTIRVSRLKRTFLFFFFFSFSFGKESFVGSIGDEIL